ncbi:hypothetical protein ACLBWX_21815 [Methylobacterium sp. M6A4_1b]
MSDSFALTTVLLSAMVSIVTGFLGALLSTGWVRRQERRTYGLALLAEVRSIQRSLLSYLKRIEYADVGARSPEYAASPRLWRQDLAVFANNSGRIGLFSSRTAIELIEFYHQVRWLEARVAEIEADGLHDATFARWLEGQRQAIHRTHQRSRYLGRLLHREIPVSLASGVCCGLLRRRGRLVRSWRHRFATPG